MTPGDRRLVAALGILRNQLDPLIEEILAGQLNEEERRALALVLCTIAADLDPEISVREIRTQMHRVPSGEQLRPAGPRPLPFSTSGP